MNYTQYYLIVDAHMNFMAGIRISLQVNGKLTEYIFNISSVIPH